MPFTRSRRCRTTSTRSSRTIDAQTMQIHHDKHHQAYVDNAEQGARRHRLGRPPRSRRCSRSSRSSPRTSRTAVRNNVGGHANHSLFWEIMSPDGGGEPGGELGACDRRRPSAALDALKEQLNAAGDRGASAPAGRGSSGTAPASPSTRRRTRTARSWRATTPLLGHRRLGARLLPELPEPPARLRRGLVERRELGRRRVAVRGARGLSSEERASVVLSLDGCAAASFKPSGHGCVVTTTRWSCPVPVLPRPRARSIRGPTSAQPMPTCSAASPRATGAPSRCSTAATRGRCYGLALRHARRPRPRRGRRPGGVHLGLALGRQLPARARPRAHRGSTRSRATRSSTGPARAASRSPRRPTRRRASPARPSAPRRPSSPGASIAPSRSCRRRSARRSSSPTGAGSRRARSPEYLGHPARNGEDAHPQRPGQARDAARRRDAMTGPISTS